MEGSEGEAAKQQEAAESAEVPLCLTLRQDAAVRFVTLAAKEIRRPGSALYAIQYAVLRGLRAVCCSPSALAVEEERPFAAAVVVSVSPGEESCSVN